MQRAKGYKDIAITHLENPEVPEYTPNDDENDKKIELDPNTQRILLIWDILVINLSFCLNFKVNSFTTRWYFQI